MSGRDRWVLEARPHRSKEGSPGLPPTLRRRFLALLCLLPPPSEVAESWEKLSQEFPIATSSARR